MAVLAASRRFAALLALGLALAGCYAPLKPGCAFSCVEDGLCPAGYSCGGDGLCHRDDGQGTCDLPAQVDAAGDAADGGEPPDGGDPDASDGP